MMDELRLSLKTKFMRGVASKLISKFILKQTGVKVDINLDVLDVTSFNGDALIKLNMVAKVDEKEIIKVMKNI